MAGELRKAWALLAMPLVLVVALNVRFETATLARADEPSPVIVGAVASPERSGTLYVLAAGPNADPLAFGSLRLLRLFKSVDRGETWSTVPTPGLQFQRVDYLTMDYARPDNLYAASYGGVLSGGPDQIWQQLSAQPAFATAVQVDPASPSRLYASGLAGGDVSFSEDSGRTWRRLDLPGNAGADLLLTPDGKTLYAINANPGASPTTLYTTGTARISWQRLSPPVSYFHGLAYDPSEQALYMSSRYGAGASAGIIYRLQDGSWQTVADFGPKYVEVLAVDALPPKTLYAVVEDSLLRSMDEGATWQPLALPSVPTPVQGADALRSYYRDHDGLRLMGRPLSDADNSLSVPSQYFEKGRLEDHSATVSDGDWRYMFGLLADELQNAKANLPVGGDVSSLSYASLHLYARPEARVAAPIGFQGGWRENPDGSAFVPYDSRLAPAPGHVVAAPFWSYINRVDLFPGGWLHDLGLPINEPLSAIVDKGALKSRAIVVQAFQRAILTYDPLNPPDWKVERANIGSDYRKVFPGRVP